MSAQVVPVLVRLARLSVADALARAEDVLLVLLPQGGQGGSRRNAWSAMAGEAALAAARRESQAAIDSAWARRGIAAGGLTTVPALAVAESGG